jgi:hypothetical protein
MGDSSLTLLLREVRNHTSDQGTENELVIDCLLSTPNIKLARSERPAFEPAEKDTNMPAFTRSLEPTTSRRYC